MADPVFLLECLNIVSFLLTMRTEEEQKFIGTLQGCRGQGIDSTM